MRSRSGRAASAVVLCLLLMPLGCGGKGSDAKAPAQKKPPGGTTPALPPLPEEVPVTVEFVGLTPDKESARYRIHVITDKPVTQVDVGYVYTGADGNEQRGTVVWQNAADPKRPPLEKGQDYEDRIPVGRGATNVTFKALHVVFKDKSIWAR